MTPWTFIGIYAIGWIVTSLVMYYIIERDGNRHSAIAWGFVWPLTWMGLLLIGMLALGFGLISLIDSLCELIVDIFKQTKD